MTEPSTPPKVDAKTALIRGAAWQVGMRWIVRLMGFFNTIIMARILMPADYGVVAMSMLVVGLIQALVDFGAGTAIMRKAEASVEEIDSAWTLRTMQSIAMSVILLAVSYPASLYFNEPKVLYVLWVMAVCVGIAGAENIGPLLARKSFDFALNFRIKVISKLLSVVATVVAGLLLHDYRALVIGISTGFLTEFALSFTMHPYRPRWTTSKIGEIWHVTKWLMLAGVGGFILRKGDEVLAGRIGATRDFGAYNVGSDLGLMPTSEVGPAMLTAFLPVLATMRGAVEEMNAAVVKTAGAINTVTLPLGIGFAAVATQATVIMLGPEWSIAAQYVAPFAVIGAIQTIQNPYKTLLTMRGQTKVQSHAVWLEFALFLVAAMLLVPSHFLLGLVWARGIGSSASLVAILLACRKYCGLALRPSIRVTLRPLLGSVIMFALVSWVTQQFTQAIVGLVVGIGAGAVFYVAWSLVSWHVVGKPSGLEDTALEYLSRLKKRPNAAP